MGRAERLAVRIDYQDRIAGRRLAAIQNIARENPGMAGSDAPVVFPADSHCVQVSSLPVTRNEIIYSYFTAIITALLEAPLTLSTSGWFPDARPVGTCTFTWYSPTKSAANPLKLTGALELPMVAVVAATVSCLPVPAAPSAGV